MTESDIELVKKVGLPQKLACKRLGISLVAFKGRLSRLMVRYGVENRAALAIKAIRDGVLSINDFEVREFGK